MGDQKPPRLVGDERETLLALLQYQRHSVVKKVSGVSEEDARRSMVPSGTSLLWLVRHMARAESLWLLHRFAGQPAVIDDDQVRPEDTLQTAVAAYRQTWIPPIPSWPPHRASMTLAGTSAARRRSTSAGS